MSAIITIIATTTPNMVWSGSSTYIYKRKGWYDFFDDYTIIRSKRLKCKFHVNDFNYFMFKKRSKNKKSGYHECGIDILQFEIQD